jgi:ubiquinone/menaquinone biosynthesis C-methylase UbiE
MKKSSVIATIVTLTSAGCVVVGFVPKFATPRFSSTKMSHPTAKPRTTPVKTKEKESRYASSRKKWGIDKVHPDEYWYNNKIHTLGNTGFGGALHALLAPLATKLIDNVAYKGVDIRRKVIRSCFISASSVCNISPSHNFRSLLFLVFVFQVAMELAGSVPANKAHILDLCCGVGMSTRALQDAFPNAELVVGIDTSPEMIRMATFLTRCRNFFDFQYHIIMRFLKKSNQSILQGLNKDASRQVSFANSNAENTELPGHSFDLVTVMYSLHEAPRQGRDRILREARRLLQPGGILALLDLSTDYKPSDHMLAGEPYVLEYQANIQRQLQSVKGFSKAVYKTIVPGHVGMWLLKATSSP